jgi:hypothetical protein
MILATAGISYLVFEVNPSLADSSAFMAIIFTLVILSAMGVLGGFHALCLAIFGKRLHMVWDFGRHDS